MKFNEMYPSFRVPAIIMLPQQPNTLQLAKTLRNIANLLESGLEVGTKNLETVQHLVATFSMAEVSFDGVDFTSRCPPEVLQTVLRYLPPADLKAAVLVSKRWRQVGENRSLWSWSKVTMLSGGVEWSSALDMLKSHRGIRKLEAQNLSGSEARQLMLALNENSSVEELNLGSSCMSQVEPVLLGDALSGLKRVNLENIIFAPEQLDTLFFSLHKTSSLNLEEVDLSGVSPMLFTSAAKLSELHISNTMLTQEQVASLWTAFKNNTVCNIKSISMSGINLAGVEVEALISVANKVCKIDLSNTELTDEQITALVSSLRENQEIQEVDLSDNTLTGVDPDFLAAAMSTTRKLSLVNTGLTAVQVEKLLGFIAANCPMESLNLSANVLSMVEPELMAQAVNKLKDVTLIDTNLSVNQVLRIDHIF